jgi:hypothetical protein
MIRCPQCGTDNLDGSEYCDECGYQLSAMRGAPASGVTPHGGGPSAPPRTAPPAAVPPRDQVSYGAASLAGGPEPKMTPLGMAPADFSPPPPNVPSVAMAPQPYPAAPPAADVFAVAPPLFSAGASAPSSMTPPAPPVPPPMPAPPAMSSPPVTPAPPPVAAVPTASHPAPPQKTPTPGSPPPATSSTSVPRAKLVIQRGGTVGKEFLLTETESNIGRWDADGGIFPDVDLDQDDPEAKVSRRHARIVCQDGQYVLEDLGSTNGTFVNRGRRLLPGNRHPLNDGDEIIVGKTFLKFHYIR